MNLQFVCAVLISCSLPALAQGTTAPSVNLADGKPTGLSFALVVRSKVLTTEGDWKQGDRLRGFATTHPGSYIVFVKEDSLQLLQNSAAVSEAAQLYGVLETLGQQQAVLGAKQTPLIQRQNDLDKQMKLASSPEEMHRIGAEEGRIGAQQGAIGREQGEVGRKQCIAGRAFYDKVQNILTLCLSEQSCKPATHD
ncbi:hypothetical protein [Granulicella tundricola]|uniref:hypothetical protein n=1 Tax=Granulicella tundricola TaxID=940615 RepID=UPI00059EDC21|nr:hypothetical protein [Granulicella tundricola]